MILEVLFIALPARLARWLGRDDGPAGPLTGVGSQRFCVAPVEEKRLRGARVGAKLLDGKGRKSIGVAEQDGIGVGEVERLQKSVGPISCVAREVEREGAAPTLAVLQQLFDFLGKVAEHEIEAEHAFMGQDFISTPRKGRSTRQERNRIAIVQGSNARPFAGGYQYGPHLR